MTLARPARGWVLKRQPSVFWSAVAQRICGKLFLLGKSHTPIPFPRFAIVGRKCLTPGRRRGISFVPFKHDDDGLSCNNILRVKPSNVALERADLRYIQDHDIAIGPIQTPESGFRIKQAKGSALKRDAVEYGGELIGIAKAIENLMTLAGRLELKPLGTLVQTGFKFLVMDFPVADEKIEILVRRGCRSNDF